MDLFTSQTETRTAQELGRIKNRERVRRHRAKKKAQVERVEVLSTYPLDPAAALAKWSEETLKVPDGHPRAGEPLILPTYGVEFLRDALTHRESFLCIGRKNAKSAIIAVYLLGRLVGPLRQPGYRAGVCSVNAAKANELKMQMESYHESIAAHRPYVPA